ncbi:MAG TPA: UrcA family protein [Rhizomicrobium sp.]|jgi:UrcA family protein
MSIMRIHSLRFALLASAFALAASSASAQESSRYRPPAYGSDPTETVHVTGPHYRAETTRLNGVLEPVSLSNVVRYDDLNLRSWHGVRTLRRRIRREAWQTCSELAEAYPVYEQPGTSCYKSAVETGLLRANAVIRDVRDNDPYDD